MEDLPNAPRVFKANVSGPSLAVIGRLAAVEELTLNSLPSHANPSRPARIRRIRLTSVPLPRPADRDHHPASHPYLAGAERQRQRQRQRIAGCAIPASKPGGDKPATPRTLLLLRRPSPHLSWLLTPVRYSSLLPGPHPPDQPVLWECGPDLPPRAQVRPKGQARRSAMFCLRRCVPIPPSSRRNWETGGC